MATALKLRSDIKKLKKGLEAKGVSASVKEKLKSQLKKAENELESLKKTGKAPKKSSVAGTKVALTALQKLIQRKKYGVYQGAGVDLKKDAGEGALATGRRESKGLKANQFSGKGNAKANKGNVYYEYRPNRLDVKQPKKRQSYPKLEKGGYMADGGQVKDSSILQALNGYNSGLTKSGIAENLGLSNYRFGKYASESQINSIETELKNLIELGYVEEGGVGYKITQKGSRYLDTIPYQKRERGGYMADGGETDNWEVRKLYDEYYPYGLYLNNSLVSGLQSNNKKLIETKKKEIKERLNMAKGGMIKVEEDAYGKSAYIPYKGETFLLEWNTERPTKASTVISDRSFRRLDEDSSLYQHLLVTLLKAMHENKVQYAEEGAKLAKGVYMADGGKIENNYRGLSDSELWDKWNTRQKIHFLEDHRDKYSDNDVLTKYTNIELSNMSFDKLPSVLQSMVYEHRIDGQYASGGYMADGGQTQGKNGYVAFYKGKRIEVYADTMYQAQLKAAKIFNAKKSYEVNVVLAEVDGKQYYNSTMADGGMMAKGGEFEVGDMVELKSGQKAKVIRVEESWIGVQTSNNMLKDVYKEDVKKLAEDGMMAKGGLTDHGLKIGDKITSKFDNVVVVENDGKTFVVNLNIGKRWSDNAWFTLNHGNTSKYSKMADGGNVMSTTHRMSK